MRFVEYIDLYDADVPIRENPYLELAFLELIRSPSLISMCVILCGKMIVFCSIVKLGKDFLNLGMTTSFVAM